MIRIDLTDEMFEELGYEIKEVINGVHRYETEEEIIDVCEDDTYIKMKNTNNIKVLREITTARYITEAEDKAIHKKIEELQQT